jgi:hypothetical protein
MRHSKMLQIITLFIITGSLAFSTNKNGNPVEYLIITPSMFVDSLQPLIASKISRGLSVHIATLDQIKLEFTGRDIQEQIRNCIIDRYKYHNAYWVLLVGKADADDSPDTNSILNSTILDKSWEMPVRYVYCPAPKMNLIYIPTDNYYSCLDGNWDSDGDNRFGENSIDCATGISEVDWFPDVCVGRIPCVNALQLSNYIHKILLDDYSGYSLSQLNSLQIQCRIDTNETDLDVPGKILGDLTGYDPPTSANVTNELNNGSYPLLFFTGDGNRNGIGVSDGTWTGNSLLDGGSKFFGYFSCCEVGHTDYRNFDTVRDQSQRNTIDSLKLSTIIQDQSQVGINGLYYVSSTIERWQEFKPTVSNLSKIELSIWKFGLPGNLIVKIATSSGEILQQHSIDPSLINNTTGWVGVDISPALTLTPRRIVYQFLPKLQQFILTSMLGTGYLHHHTQEVFLQSKVPVPALISLSLRMLKIPPWSNGRNSDLQAPISRGSNYISKRSARPGTLLSKSQIQRG